jgi:phosphotransferase system HPr (HPr) family protein
MIMFRNLRPEIERITRKLTLHNRDGLQALPATEFVNCVLSFKSTVTIHFKGKQYPADRILEILLADLNGGDTFVLEAKGPDARRAVDRIGRLSMFVPGQSLPPKSFLRWEPID